MTSSLYFFIALIWIILAVVIYFDAKKRNKGAGIWFFIVFVSGVLGVAAYGVSLSNDDYQRSSRAPNTNYSGKSDSSQKYSRTITEVTAIVRKTKTDAEYEYSYPVPTNDPEVAKKRFYNHLELMGVEAVSEPEIELKSE